MKKEVVGIFLIMFFLVFTINFIIADNGASVGNSDNENQIVGGCGTVTPGLENECCKNLGYDKWDSEKNECIGNQTQQRERIVAANQILARKL